MDDKQKLSLIQQRVEQLGFHCPTPPLTHAISAPVYALICMPMHYVATALMLKTDQEVDESLIEDLFGVKNVRESFAIGNEIAELPVSEADAVVLKKLLVMRRPIDSIIYDFANDTINMFFEVADNRVVLQAMSIIARTVVSIAKASGSGLFGMGAEASPEQHVVIERIINHLNLRSSEAATASLADLLENNQTS